MDEARRLTDQQLAEMEKHIKQMYRQAQAEITEKWDAYMERGEARLADLYADYQSAPAGQKAQALRRYQDALRNYTLQNKWYKDMVDATTYRIAHANEIAIAYINGQIPSIYATNFNYIEPELVDIGFDWTLRDERMIRNLMRDSLPEKIINYTKDMAWNARQINARVLQGILQGESIPKIAKRLLPVVDNNATAAVRTARTMVTRAENKGRFDRYTEYEERGLVIHKVWIATPDGRTRNWHLSMDGQEVPRGQAFVDGNGEELMYPGDPSGSPRTVYNCRCTMRSEILGVRRADGTVASMKNFRTEQTFHQQQMEDERRRRRRG